MARIRYLKPSFFKDEDLCYLTVKERLCYAGLWCFADREGRLEYRPKYLKAEIMPYDECDMAQVLDRLAFPNIPERPNKCFITIYEINSRKYIQINEFLSHQKPHSTESKSTIPHPNGAITVKEPLSNASTCIDIYKEERGMGNGESEGKEGSSPEGSPTTPVKEKKPRRKQLPPDDEWLQSLCESPAFKGVDVIKEYHKCLTWFETKKPGLKISRQRVLKWLNNAERYIIPKTQADIDWEERIRRDNQK